MRTFFVLSMLVLGVSGCFNAPSSGERLAEARALLREARTRPGATRADLAIAEAEGAVEYAELEERLRPGNPLTPQRADRALDKARSALGATDQGGR